MESKERRKVDDFILYGVSAAEQAVTDAGWKPNNEKDLERTGVMIGSGIGGLNSIAETAVLIHEKGIQQCFHQIVNLFYFKDITSLSSTILMAR